MKQKMDTKAVNRVSGFLGRTIMGAFFEGGGGLAG